MKKEYLIAFIVIIVFLVVTLSLSLLSNNKTSTKDISSQYNYHITYYNYDNTNTDEITTDEESSEEDLGDYYDSPSYNELNTDQLENEGIYLPMEIYLRGNVIYVVKQYKGECNDAGCKTDKKSYNINFSDEGKEVITNFITTKFNNNSTNEVTLYKNNLTSMELKIIDSLIYNDESYLK